jgi:hypothetical protein
MKLLLVFSMTVLLNQTVQAQGGIGEDPNLAKSTTAEAGSTFTSAVSKGDQPAFCEKCEERTSARLSNNVGVLTSTSGSSGAPLIDSSGKPVQTGQ